LTERVKLSDEQRLDWLRLIRSDNIGPRGIMAQTPQGGSFDLTDFLNQRDRDYCIGMISSRW
jgi:hypothetical protein